MCFGPHEMTREQIDKHIQEYREAIATDGYDDYTKSRWQSTLEEYEKLAKDIDNGELIQHDNGYGDLEWMTKEQAEEIDKEMAKWDRI